MEFTTNPGIWPVVHTPFTDNGSVDYNAIEALNAFYEKAGVGGLFMMGLTGEGAELNDDERKEISSFIAKKKSKGIQLASVANYSNSHEKQIEQAKMMEDTGADIIILALSYLSTDSPMHEQLLDIANHVSIPLGIYECPRPVHRFIGLDGLKALADSRRFVFMKDTCRELELLKERIALIEGTPMRLYPAQLHFLEEAVRAGAAGFCGCAANVFPAECKELFERSANGGDADGIYKDIRSAYDVLRDAKWPASCKLALRRREIPTTTVCRRSSVDDARMIRIFDDTGDPKAQTLRDLLAR